MNIKAWGCATLFPACVAFAASPYQFTAIPLPSGATWAAIPGEDGFDAAPVLNQSHQVALSYYTSDGSFQPYIWANNTFTALPLSPGYTTADAGAINDAGIVVGFERDYHATTSNPVVWSDGTVTTLDQQGQPFGAALTINNSGQIGGQAGSSMVNYIYSTSSALLWNGTVATNLGNYGESQASVVAINNNGQALISNATSVTGAHAIVLSADGTAANVNVNGQPFVVPTGMNNRGQVVGTASNYSDGSNDISFLWDNGKVTGLASLWATPSADSFGPYAVNDDDAIVGVGGNSDGGDYAALWMDGRLYDLNTLIAPDPDWNLLYATDITDDGTIVGIGQDDGNWQAFMLTPALGGAFDTSSIPEPASLALLALGSVALLRRRRDHAPRFGRP